MSDLDDTQDDLAPRYGTGPVPRALTDREIEDRRAWKELADFRAEAAAATSVAAAAEKKAVAAEAKARQMASRWGWLLGVASLLTAAAAPVGVYATKKLLAGAEASGAAGERESTRLADHATLGQLVQAVAEIKGELRALNPVGAVRLLGPPRAPTPDPAP